MGPLDFELLELLSIQSHMGPHRRKNSVKFKVYSIKDLPLENCH